MLDDFGAVLQGMTVQAQDGADEAELLGIVEVAMRAWPARSTGGTRGRRPTASSA